VPDAFRGDNVSDESPREDIESQFQVTGVPDHISMTVTHQLSVITMMELPLLIVCIVTLLIAALRSKKNQVIWLLLGLILLGIRMVVASILIYVAPDSGDIRIVIGIFDLIGIVGWISITWYCWQVFQQARFDGTKSNNTPESVTT
jgi:hypothetical protein